MKTPKALPFFGALLLSAVFQPVATPRAAAQSAGFASQVVDYTPGTGASSAYLNAGSALGKPGGNIGSGTLNPFSPNYAASELTGIGAGGQLTLALSNFVAVGPAGTREIGIFGNVGLIAASTNPPTAQNPATVFGAYSVAVSVSADGVNFVPLNGGGLITSTLPANYYANADTTNYNAAPPANPVLADFGKPFTGTLADFSGRTYAQILTTLDGSAGGTWLDLSATGLAQVGYVRFSEPAGGGNFYLNGVSSNEALLGLAVPEPGVAATLWLAAGVVLAWGVRRHARRAAAVLAAAALLGGAGRASAQMFNFSDIQNWTGTGSNQAALVIDWNDGKGPESLAWGYRWNGNATGLQMFQAIDAADPRLVLFVQDDNGPVTYGIGYDLNNNGGTFTPGQLGVDENGSASDPGDHYAEGFFTKYWAYYVTDAGSPYGGAGTWSFSDFGFGSRNLVSGSWDGYSISDSNFDAPLPDLPTAAAPAPEPSTLAVMLVGSAAVWVLVRRRFRSQTARG